MKSLKSPLLATALILTISLGVKFYFLHHPPVAFFGISFSDLMLKAGAATEKPTPIPYRDTYMEYPVLIGAFFYLVSLVSRSSNDYFLISGVVLAGFGVLTTWLLMKCLILLRHPELDSESLPCRASRFWVKPGMTREGVDILQFWILAPSLFLFTIYNWDMVAVFFMVLGIYFFLRARPFWGSSVTTLGVWTKLFPIFVLVAVGIDYLKKKRWKDLAIISSTFAVVSTVLNLPFSLASFDGWSVFFRFNQSRGPNMDSIWSALWVISDKIFGPDFHLKAYYISWVNLASLVLLVLGLLVLSWKYYRSSPSITPETSGESRASFISLAFSYLVLFLITNKVFSPPYSLWILPFFALLMAIKRSNLAKVATTAFYGFELSNAFVFFAIFQYFYLTNIKGLSMLPFPWFKLTYLGVVLRHVFLGILLFRSVVILACPESEKGRFWSRRSASSQNDEDARV